jgi:hypothetical protein
LQKTRSSFIRWRKPPKVIVRTEATNRKIAPLKAITIGVGGGPGTSGGMTAEERR